MLRLYCRFFKIKLKIGIVILFSSLSFLTCKPTSDLPDVLPQLNQEGTWFSVIETDKACYKPGEKVFFTVTLKKSGANKALYIKYKHLDNILEQETVKIKTNSPVKWSWQPPEKDYHGYLIEVFVVDENDYLDQINIAVDVSSDWRTFPRYGFLSRFPDLKKSAMDSVIRQLTRYHINGLQFYDWHYKHHMPLKGSVEKPAGTWPDIAKRTIHLTSIKHYIQAAHDRNMKTMAYNLLYGSWEDGPADGAPEMWRLYRDKHHKDPLKIDFDENWSSDIYWMNPADPGWQNYINEQTARVFQALDFDGWHVDQLGDWGDGWTWYGDPVDVGETFEPFLNAAFSYIKRPLVMNAVLQYGQAGIARSPVEFLYSEVWDPDSTFSDLIRIIHDNNTFSQGRLKTILAAYVNQGMAEKPGEANAASVLLADAVIFSTGGAHLEIGEHLLVHPYFPNNNLAMSTELQRQLVCYYDFLVAYENVLRDAVQPSRIPVETNSDIRISETAESGKVWLYPVKKDKKNILHLINFTNATTMNWRDNSGVQKEPEWIRNMELHIQLEKPVSKIWMASPDVKQGSAQVLDFEQKNGTVFVTVPALKYWSMLVMEKSMNEKVARSD